MSKESSTSTNSSNECRSGVGEHQRRMPAEGTDSSLAPSPSGGDAETTITAGGGYPTRASSSLHLLPRSPYAPALSYCFSLQEQHQQQTIRGHQGHEDGISSVLNILDAAERIVDDSVESLALCCFDDNEEVEEETTTPSSSQQGRDEEEGRTATTRMRRRRDPNEERLADERFCKAVRRQ